jgi:UDP-N-acetyl-2-amino-2-deoxyglucuronate dehydrogenase
MLEQVSPYRVGIVGCGRIARHHLEAFRLLDEFTVTAVCDEIPERVAEAAEANGAACFTDYSQFLAEAPVDVIDICTPSGLHAEMGIAAARTGRHVITEKPMALDMGSADRLVEACRAHHVGLYVVMQNRLNTTMKLLKRAVEKGRFGRIYMANATVRWHRPQSYYDAASWRGTRKLDGGAFMNQASHYVDALLWLVGTPESVVARTETFAHTIEMEDSGAAMIKFHGGALGVIEVTMCAWPRNLEGSITIIGERGSVKLGGIAVNRFETWEFMDYDDDDAVIMKANYAPPNEYGFGHLEYMKQVARSLGSKTPADVDGFEGRKSVALINAIYESARSGREVSLF